jgi:hypothetical protein
MHAFVLNWFCRYDTLKQVMERLGPEYVFVRPDELGRLYKEAQK